jgi:ABC-type Fe3+-hydroxamate transport system substrate-binding protein
MTHRADDKLIEDLYQQIDELKAEVARLKQLHYDIYEVWGGSEGLPCVTASEHYLCSLLKQMKDMAAEGK